ncbi:hypothetical protein HF1_05240 [Mycoplasma haemofelis str. Langford 1]|uniref:Uncharacterized protein n=1 Tax=Mycoplasma haemofelis (strain Langford 1) TaxID=941640 RepID=E8ZHB1_MYCHL|nr:hypothetical protein [Mycoplasma haemofelis]CBY92532.1 hypothetical protein HF1_05240 [Mycoplasma haemofelis str. Langford 1]
MQSHGNNNWSVTKIISAKEKEEFLKSVVSSHQGFTDSVRDACAGRKSNYPGWNHVQVYVYKHNDGQWVYNEPLQYGWTRVKEVVNQTNMR